MSAVIKVAAFTTGLAVIFGGAAVAGGAIGPAPRERAPEPGHAMAMTADAVRGLAVSDDGLTLRLRRTTAARGRRFALAFAVVDRDGRTVRDFDVEHTKRMHLIVVRRDLTGFQHLHPTQRRDGTWSVPVRLPDAGSYRVFADFSTGGESRTLAADLTVDGPVRWRALPAAAPVATVDGMEVTLRPDGERLDFAVTRDGRPVAVEDFLGAKGHLVALREGDLAYLHVHPDERRLRFEAQLPTPGAYRLFLQFKTGGRVHTAAFTREVGR